MNKAEVSASTTSAIVTSNSTSVAQREVPVETVYYWLSQWQMLPAVREVKP